MKRFYWVGYCEQDRLINNYRALVNTNCFCDLAISFVIEVSADQIQALYVNLQEYIHLEEVDGFPASGSYACTVVNLSFTNGSGNLKIETPSVPG